MLTHDQNEPGYRSEKLCWLPDKWEIKEFFQVFSFLKTLNLTRENLTNKIEEDSILYIHYGDIHATFNKPFLDFKKEPYIPAINKNIKIPDKVDFICDGDLIIADASEDYKGVGECVEIKNIANNKVLSGLHTIAVRDIEGKTASGFRCYILKNKKVSKSLKRIATGTSVYGFSKGNLAKLHIIIPPLAEQQKIAKILSTWDKAIEKTEELIKAKSLSKDGLMQQLMTGKQRFKEFTGQVWKYYQLGDLGHFYNGLTGKSKEDFGTGKPYIPFLNVLMNSRINPAQMDYVLIDPNEIQNQVKFGDIFFTTSSETPAEAGMPSVLLDNLDTTYLNSFCFGFRPKDFLTINPDFARFYFRSKGVRKEIFKLAQGSTRYNISKSEIMKLEIRLPSVEEQRKIASFLSGLEYELSMLNKMLLKIKGQKKGLMQKLLTGEINVKID